MTQDSSIIDLNLGRGILGANEPAGDQLSEWCLAYEEPLRSKFTDKKLAFFIILIHSLYLQESICFCFQIFFFELPTPEDIDNQLK